MLRRRCRLAALPREDGRARGRGLGEGVRELRRRAVRPHRGTGDAEVLSRVVHHLPRAKVISTKLLLLLLVAVVLVPSLPVKLLMLMLLMLLRVLVVGVLRVRSIRGGSAKGAGACTVPARAAVAAVRELVVHVLPTIRHGGRASRERGTILLLLHTLRSGTAVIHGHRLRVSSVHAALAPWEEGLSLLEVAGGTAVLARGVAVGVRGGGRRRGELVAALDHARGARLVRVLLVQDQRGLAELARVEGFAVASPSAHSPDDEACDDCDEDEAAEDTCDDTDDGAGGLGRGGGRVLVGRCRGGRRRLRGGRTRHRHIREISRGARRRTCRRGRGGRRGSDGGYHRRGARRRAGTEREGSAGGGGRSRGIRDNWCSRRRGGLRDDRLGCRILRVWDRRDHRRGHRRSGSRPFNDSGYDRCRRLGLPLRMVAPESVPGELILVHGGCGSGIQLYMVPTG